MKPPKPSIKRLLLWTGIAAVALAILTGSLVWYVYHSVKSTADRMYEPIERITPMRVSKDTSVPKKPEAAPLPGKLRAFTVLLLGVDQREQDSGRSDTIVVMTVNPAKHSAFMLSIPRDSRTAIVGRGTTDKINHAYAFGGVPMSVATVENFIDYPIDYYVKVNMEGFEKLIDAVGGVEVDNPFAFDYLKHHFERGHLSLNGEEALLYSRMRYDDPHGDLGRNTRQRDILQALMNQALNLSSITHIHSLLGKLGDSVRTNIPFGDMKRFAIDYRPAIKSIDSAEVQGKGRTIDGIWYYIVDDAERDRIQGLIKGHMLN